MNECERLEPTFEAYVAGELDEGALGPLLAHCRDCETCRRLVELHRDLAALASRVPQPDATELEDMEARVLRGVERRPGGLVVGTRARARRWIGWVPYAAAAMFAATLLFVAGFVTGLDSPRNTTPEPGPGITERLVSAIRADAMSNRALTDVADSRFTYSDVSFRRVKNDKVALDFDVTTHVQLLERLGSELVQDVLAQALLDPSSTGTRLKAMALTSFRMTRKTRDALLVAMRHDPSLAVRLGALAALSDRLDDPEVEAAVLAALRDDDAVQMRLLALDSLAAHSVDRGRIREAIREKPRPGNEALRVRLAEYEKRL
jgi:hypothetical protein